MTRLRVSAYWSTRSRHIGVAVESRKFGVSRGVIVGHFFALESRLRAPPARRTWLAFLLLNLGTNINSWTRWTDWGDNL